ncbi:unnamed protein product [Phaeothamnion confervicola]
MLRPAAWQCLTGGVILHLCLGTLYLWGNVSVYVTSYLRLYNPDITEGETLYILAGAMLGQACVMTAGGLLQHVLGIRLTALAGGWLLAGGVLLSSMATTLAQFVVTYGVMFGVGIGLAYSCPLVCGFMWMPKRRGFVSGVIVAGFGGGAFVFNALASVYVNPENESPTIGYEGQVC